MVSGQARDGAEGFCTRRVAKAMLVLLGFNVCCCQVYVRRFKACSEGLCNRKGF